MLERCQKIQVFVCVYMLVFIETSCRQNNYAPNCKQWCAGQNRIEHSVYNCIYLHRVKSRGKPYRLHCVQKLSRKSYRAVTTGGEEATEKEKINYKQKNCADIFCLGAMFFFCLVHTLSRHNIYIVAKKNWAVSFFTPDKRALISGRNWIMSA